MNIFLPRFFSFPKKIRKEKEKLNEDDLCSVILIPTINIFFYYTLSCLSFHKIFPRMLNGQVEPAPE